jgi:hypothetical protein
MFLSLTPLAEATHYLSRISYGKADSLLIVLLKVAV